MSKKVDTGEVFSKIQGRPPIEYLRKLAGSPEQAAEYAKRAAEAEIVNAEHLGLQKRIYQVYVPELDKNVQYGHVSLNALIEWQWAMLEGMKKTEVYRADLEKAGVTAKRLDDLMKKVEQTATMEHMKRLVYLLLKEASPNITEKEIGEYPGPAITQMLIAMNENTPFLEAVQPAQPVSLTPNKSPSQ